jgi:predicted RNA-binding Zn-ribbon protein involved in translation (DUF1610 family)
MSDSVQEEENRQLSPFFCTSCKAKLLFHEGTCPNCGKRPPQWTAELREEAHNAPPVESSLGKALKIVALSGLSLILLLFIFGIIRQVITPSESPVSVLKPQAPAALKVQPPAVLKPQPPAVLEADPPAKPPPPPTPEDRIITAQLLDQLFLHAGIESTTVATGPAHTTLHITDILAGRVRAQSMQENIPWDKLRALGFRKVVYTNGLNDMDNVMFTWRLDQMK